MKTSFSFLENTKFTGTIALIFFIVSVFLAYTNALSKHENVYTSDGILKTEFRYLNDNEQKEVAINNRTSYQYAEKTALNVDTLEFLDPKGIMLKLTVSPIVDEETYFLLNTGNSTKEYISVYSDETELEAKIPKIIDYNSKSNYNFYLLPMSEEITNIYIYFEREFNEKGFAKPTLTVGTESSLIMSTGRASIMNFVVAGILMIFGLFIYIIFFITDIENYTIVKIFAIAFFVISLQCIIFSQFVMLSFNQISYYFTLMKIVTYYLICIASYLIPYNYVTNDKIRKFYIVNIILASCAIVGSSYLFITQSVFAGSIIGKYNVYYMFMCIFSLVLNFYDFERDKDFVGMFRSFAFSTMVTLNILFYYYETDSSSGTYRNPYYVVLFIFITCVVFYVCSIFYYRNKKNKDNRLFIYDEKGTIDRLYKSNKNTITTTNILQISENILSDIKGIYPNNKFAMIIHRGLDKEVTIPAHTKFKGDIERHANKVFKKYYKNIEKSSYTVQFAEDTAILIFRSSTGEILIIYFKNDIVLTELDKLAAEILASPVLLSFNNCRIYEEMANTEKELLYAIGKLTYKKSESVGNIWRVGEYSYLLATNTGLSKETAKNIRIASYIHDIGKIGMSDEYVNIDKISSVEEPIFYQHTKIGYDMLSKFNSETMKLAGICSLFHHEKYNGKGFIGRFAEEIPIEVRIVIIAIDFEDFYAKLALEKPEATTKELLEECYVFLSMHKQTNYDPLLVQLFINDKKGIEKIILESKDKE